MHRPSLFSKVFYRTSRLLSTTIFEFSPYISGAPGHTDAVPAAAAAANKKEVPHMEERKNAKYEQNTSEQNTQNTNKNAKNTKNAKNCK